MARRWTDRDIAWKMFVGLVFVCLSFGILIFAKRIWPWGWVMGVIFFFWGLLSIGDKKHDWGNW